MCQMCQIPDIPIVEFSQQIKPMYVINNNSARSVESHHRGTDEAHLEMLANVKHENGLNSILSLSLCSQNIKILLWGFGTSFKLYSKYSPRLFQWTALHYWQFKVTNLLVVVKIK